MNIFSFLFLMPCRVMHGPPVAQAPLQSAAAQWLLQVVLRRIGTCRGDLSVVDSGIQWFPTP